MTTTMHSAPLIERARAALASYEAEQAADQARRNAEDQGRMRNHLVATLQKNLGITVEGNAVEFVDEYPTLRYEGDLFAFRPPNFYAIDGGEHEYSQLVVESDCAKGCSTSLWCGVEDLISLARATNGGMWHRWDCLNERSKTPPAVAKEERAIDDVLAAAEVYAQAITLILELEDGRAAEKSAAIRRLMQTENDETGKQHSASSAEKIVETDGEYAAYRKRQRGAEVEKHRAEAALFAAKQRARLAVDAVRAGNDA
jgi:hypothetical protein